MKIDNKKQNKVFLFLAALLALNFFVYFSVLAEKNSPILDFLDVGQGDSSLLSFPGSGKIMIDAGLDKNIVARLGKALGFFNSQIDILIVTHQDWDHFGGFWEIIKNNNPKVFAYSGAPVENESFQALLDLARQKNIAVISLRRGDKIKIGGDFLEVLSPSEEDIKNNPGEENNNSLIFLGKIGSEKILFSGDAESKVIEKFIEYIGNVDILKISHHGAKNGVSQKLLETIRPKIALIGVGAENKFGHPSEKAIELLSYLGTEILRTDKMGNIRVKLR